nr:MAG TPA: hypothetical protein [Caudoviricetes sp.]
MQVPSPDVIGVRHVSAVITQRTECRIGASPRFPCCLGCCADSAIPDTQAVRIRVVVDIHRTTSY